MFTTVRGPDASINTSSGTMIVGFSKSFGIGTARDTEGSVNCSISDEISVEIFASSLLISEF